MKLFLNMPIKLNDSAKLTVDLPHLDEKTCSVRSLLHDQHFVGQVVSYLREAEKQQVERGEGPFVKDLSNITAENFVNSFVVRFSGQILQKDSTKILGDLEEFGDVTLFIYPIPPRQ